MDVGDTPNIEDKAASDSPLLEDVTKSIWSNLKMRVRNEDISMTENSASLSIGSNLKRTLIIAESSDSPMYVNNIFFLKNLKK